MQISLIVATRDRPEHLARLLQSLQHQQCQDFEVIVVDQSGTDNLARNSTVIASAARTLAIQHVPTNTRGLSRARNIGLSLAAGRLVALPDDDCWYSNDTLLHVVTWFDGHHGYSFLTGQYTEPGVINTNFSSQSRVLENPTSSFDCSSVTLFFDRKTIESAQLRFDEAIGAGTDLPAGEECDFIIRLITTGSIGFYDPTLVIYHQIERQSDSRLKLHEKYEIAYGYVIGKHVFIPRIAIRLTVGLIKLLLDILLLRGGLPRLKSRIKGIRLGLKASRRNGDQHD